MRTGSWLSVLSLAVLVMGFLVIPARGRAQDESSSNCVESSAPSADVQIDTFPRLDLELARTPQEHERGLMFRDYLPPDSGMLFVYQAESREGYWMFQTLIPLSIAWLNRDGIILDIKDMPRLDDPFSFQEAAHTVYNSEEPYWYALEVNQGWFFEHGVGVGQQVVFCLDA